MAYIKKSSQPKKHRRRERHNVGHNTWCAEALREEGNALFKIQDYERAIFKYTKAIDISPENYLCYSNRCACYMAQGQYKKALEDAMKSVSFNLTFTKGYIRLLKCSIALGDLSNASKAMLKIKELDPENPIITMEAKNLEVISCCKIDFDRAYQNKEYKKAIDCINHAMDSGVMSTQYILRKAECLALLGNYSLASQFVTDMIKLEENNAEAVYIQGLCLYYMAKTIDLSITKFAEALRLDPNHQRARDYRNKANALKEKKELGNNAFRTSLLGLAFRLYTEGLEIDPSNALFNAQLYFNRGTVNSSMGRLKDAITDYTTALHLDSDYFKALIRRADCYGRLHQYQNAIRDYEEICKISCDQKYKDLLNEARAKALHQQTNNSEVKKRKKYYVILGVESNATASEIKKAYKRLAKLHHPDRHVDEPECKQHEQEEEFKKIKGAYDVLSDSVKRSAYDSPWGNQDD